MDLGINSTTTKLLRYCYPFARLHSASVDITRKERNYDFMDI